MHKFPPVAEMAHLIGDTLEQVCLDPFSTQFRFERNFLISEYAVEHTEPDGTVWKFQCVASEAPPTLLHHLVGRTVDDVRSEGFRLILLFNDGAALHVLSAAGPYEAGHIEGCDKFIVF